VTPIVNGNELETGVGALSVTVTVNAKEGPALDGDGVPLNEPSLPSVSPGGKAPAVTFQ